MEIWLSSTGNAESKLPIVLVQGQEVTAQGLSVRRVQAIDQRDPVENSRRGFE
jgi:hypothetical protein